MGSKNFEVLGTEVSMGGLRSLAHGRGRFAGCHAYREAADQAAIAALDATGRPFAPDLLRVAIGQSEYCLP